MNNDNKINANYLNSKQIEDICNVLTDIYTEDKLRTNGTIINQIDIEDFVIHYLGCRIVYESIEEQEAIDRDMDCMGVISDGIKPISVVRDGSLQKIIFPKDTIVLDKYLNGPNQANHKRFVIAHEAGHVIKNRMFGTVSTEYNHAGGVVLTSTAALTKRYSIKELEANNFAACLLMPEGMVAMLMNRLYDDERIVKYQNDILDGEDIDKIKFMAKSLGVSYMAMFYRLKNLGFMVDGVLESYVEDTVLGGSDDKRRNET